MSNRITNLTLVAFCVLFVLAVYLTINLNPPFGIATMSRALYVDEGFYADAAQNFVKFGRWGMPYDLRHWPGAPLVTALQTAAFSVFGVSVTTARLISAAFSVLSILCLYFIAARQFGSRIALWLTVATGTNIAFFAHSRAAIADPVAMGFAMLAMLVYLRMNLRSLAIPISLILGYCAVLAKMYFLFAFVTILTFCLVEVVIQPLITKQKILKKQCVVFMATIAVIISSYILLRQVFAASFAEFIHINSNKIPNFQPGVLFGQFMSTLKHLPFNTKTPLHIIACVAAAGVLIVRILKAPGAYAGGFDRAQRAGWMLLLFLLLGLGTIAALNFPNKAHYFYFAIIPIGFISVWGLKSAWPGILSITVPLILIAQIGWQFVYYQKWLSRENNDSIIKAEQTVLSRLHSERTDPDQITSVIGQYASQLGFADRKIMPLDIRWSTRSQVCARVDYWRPQYMVDFYFPGRGSYSTNMLNSCDVVASVMEISRLPVFDKWQDEIHFHRIIYTD